MGVGQALYNGRGEAAGVGGRLVVVPFRRGLEIIVLRFGLSSGVAEDMRRGAEWRAWGASAS